MKFKKNYLKMFIMISVIILALIIIYFAFPAIIGLAGYLIDLFLPFLIGYLYVSIVKPLTRFFNRRLKIPNALCAIIVMILSIGVVGGIVFVIIMKAFDQVRNIYMQFPIIYQGMIDTVDSTKHQLSGLFDTLPQNIQISIQTLGTDITTKITDFINTRSLPMISYAGATAKALPKVFIGLVVFLLSSFFMLSEPEKFTGLFKNIISPSMSKKWEKVKNEIKIYLGGYVKAQGIIMTVAFCIIFIGLSILNVSFSLIIAMGIALIDALPFFGSGAVFWPWALVKFINGDFRMGVGLMIIYVVIVITRQFIEPKIVSKKMGTNSLLTLMSMYIGYRLFNIGGMILGPVILMLVISFYKAGIFDPIIKLLKFCVNAIKHEYGVIKGKIKEYGE